MSTSVQTGRINELIALFGRHHLAEMRAMKRSVQTSMLFDLPRRSPLGWHCLYEHEAQFLREVCEYATPEEIGLGMRRLGSRPYLLQPFIIMCSYLAARQQRMLDLGLRQGDPFPEERPEDLVFVVDFWARMQGASCTDDVILPGEIGGAWRILEAEAIADLERRAQPVDPERYTKIRRMAATLELYEFILHGEQRDGIFGHGPYALGDGRILFCKEFNDLRNEYMPWAQTQARLPVANVVIAHVAHDVQIRCDMFGSMTVEPHELGDRLDAIVVLTNDGGELRELGEDAWTELQHVAADAQEELFLTAVEWDERYKIEYGAPLFANHLKPIFDLVGMPEDAGRRAMEACQQTADRMVDELLATEMPSIWAQMADPQGDMYWPMVS
jgi:hypothetical protein